MRTSFPHLVRALVRQVVRSAARLRGGEEGAGAGPGGGAPRADVAGVRGRWRRGSARGWYGELTAASAGT